MKWLLLICVFVAAVYPIWGQVFLPGSNDASLLAPDYTLRYAELASPVPSNVNVDDLVASLRAASNHP